MNPRKDSPVNTPPHVATFAPGAKVTATFETTEGTFVCRLFAEQCPITVGNFVALARGEAPWTEASGQEVTRPLYDGTVFHRVIPDFMIQGGDPEGNGTGGPGYRFGDEIDDQLKHDKPGVLSMANAGPNSNGSQFFVTEVATPWLDGKHSVFGEVIEGIDIVHSIARAPADPRNRPKDAIKLTRLRITEA